MITREEAITQLELLLEYCESMMTSEYPVWRRDCEALQMLIAALRPISREQVEKVWRGCRSCKGCRSCVYSIHDLKDMPCKKCDPNAEGIVTEYKPSNFCPVCGKPLTDEAVKMVMERLEALYEQKV